MKKILFGFMVAALFMLTACQSVQPAASKTLSPVVIEKNMVHSYHTGVSAVGQPYVLLVLNEQGMQTLAVTAKQGEPYTIRLDGHDFTQSAQVNTGFLVLSSTPADWTAQRLSQLLH